MNWQNLEIINELVSKGVPFVFYRTPNSTEPILIVQTISPLLKISITDLEHKSCFVIAPFESAKTNEIFLIEPTFIIKDPTQLPKLEQYLSGLPYLRSKKSINNHQLSKNEYLEKANYFIEKIKSGEFKKIVLSRVLTMEIVNSIDYSKFCDNLCEGNKNAFVYLLSTPETGIWAGATPEALLSKQKDKLETMAVAGTRLLSDFNNNPTWGKKEIEEQDMVSTFIENILSGLGVKDFKTKGPETIKAGKIVHLKTTFSINSNCLKNRLGIFIKGLHPTPAVCGLPKADAYHLIEKAETHKRKLYTGFLGPWNLEKESKLFVNLRCAEFTDNKIFAYVGGGLTKDSVPRDEWNETINKSQTLLSVVEKL